MNSFSLAMQQVRWHNKAFWRNPAAAFFIFAFPLVLMVILTSLFSAVFDFIVLPTGREVTPSTFYTATSLSLAVITACFMNIGLTVTFLREEGVLKRIRGTPLPAVSYLVSKIVHAVAIMVLLVLIVAAFGALFFDVGLPTTSLFAFVVTLLIGSASLSALGLAISAITPNADAAPAIVNGTLFPLLMISGLFFPLDRAPRWLGRIADFFPFKPFTDAVSESFLPPTTNPAGWSWTNLAVVAAWGVVALVFTLRRFRWEPSR